MATPDTSALREHLRDVHGHGRRKGFPDRIADGSLTELHATIMRDYPEERVPSCEPYLPPRDERLAELFNEIRLRQARDRAT